MWSSRGKSPVTRYQASPERACPVIAMVPDGCGLQAVPERLTQRVRLVVHLPPHIRPIPSEAEEARAEVQAVRVVTVAPRDRGAVARLGEPDAA